MAFDLDGYNTVPERIAEFREKYPDGRLRQGSVEFREFGGKSWVIYTAEAWRSADDPAPAHGTAWEEVPGRTQFTRDSELQNAETAAWGRAIVAALAADTSKGIASQEEVRNRQASSEDIPRPQVSKPLGAPPEGWRSKVEDCATEKDLTALYEADAKDWFTPEVQLAFTARKKVLQRANA